MFFDAGLINIISEVAEKIEDMVGDCHYGRKSSQTKDMTAHARAFKKEYRMNWVPPVPVPQSDSEVRARIFRMKTEIAYFTKLAMEIGRMDIAEDLMHAESGLENAAAILPSNISNLAPVNALNIAMTQPRPAAFGLAA
jgi:hypothetical protein